MPRTNPQAPTGQPEERLLRIVAFLFSHSGVVTREEIWEAFPDDYSGSFPAKEKKWTRDKQSLDEAGIPIHFVSGDPESPAGYRIDPREYWLPAIPFKPHEMAMLRAAGSAALRLAGHPWHADLDSALRKLRWYGAESVPAPTRPAISYPAREVGAHEARFVEVIRDAVSRRKRVRLKYFTAKRQDETEREVDIYGYAWRRGVWLFAGHCHLRSALRVFYVARLREIGIVRPKATATDYSIPRDFDIRTFADQQTWEYWVHEPVEVEVLFRAKPDLEVTPSLVAQQLPNSQIEERPEGVLARVKATNTDALVRHVFSIGLDAEILGPAHVRESARRLLASVASGGEP